MDVGMKPIIMLSDKTEDAMNNVYQGSHLNGT